jgi:dienelactone hydrolase
MRACWLALWVTVVMTLSPRPSAAGRSRAIDNLFRPAARPAAPVETVHARDLPLDLRGGGDGLANRLKFFDAGSGPFDYTLQLVGEEEAFRLYRLVYQSPIKTPWPENNVVPAEFYVPRDASAAAKVPAAVVLDILDGSAILPRMMARAAAQQGLAALYVPMPCYNERRPADNAHEKVLRDDPTKTVDGLRQTVMDVRRARAILASRPEIDDTNIGITGISLGGIMTALTAGVDGQFTRAVPILSGGDIADITFHCHEMRKLRAALLDKGISREDASALFAPVDPLNFAKRVGADRCLMINAANDEVIPKKDTQALAAAIGDPQVMWLQAGHYSALTYFPLMQKTVIDFLRDGKRPAANATGDAGAKAKPAPRRMGTRTHPDYLNRSSFSAFTIARFTSTGSIAPSSR